MIKSLKNKINLSNFQKNIISMLKGNSIAQIISVIGALIIAKTYGSNAYGIYAVYLSISGILAIPNTLQLEYAIVLSNSKNIGKQIMSSILVIPLLISIFYLFILYIFSGEIDQHANKITLFTAILGAILMAQNKGLIAFLTIQKKFKYLANSKIITSISTVVFQLLLFNYFKSEGLIIGSLIGVFITFIYLIKLNWKSISKFSIVKLARSIAKHQNLVKFGLLSNLINALANNIIPILILTYFSSSQSGTYALSIKILVTPLFLISSAIFQVYFEKASKLFKFSKEKLYQFTKQIVWSNSLIMLTILLSINLLGVRLLTYFFDESWKDMSTFILLLSFLVLARSTFNPISSIVEITKRNHIDLIFNSYLLIINLIGFYIGYIYNDLIYMIVLITILGSIGYLVILWYFLRLLKSYSLITKF